MGGAELSGDTVNTINNIQFTTAIYKQQFSSQFVCILCHLSQEWTKLEIPEGAPWPAERSSHAACCLNYGQDHPQFLVTGGIDKNGNTINDMWILDVQSGRWREVSGDVHMKVRMAGSISTCSYSIYGPIRSMLIAHNGQHKIPHMMFVT